MKLGAEVCGLASYLLKQSLSSAEFLSYRPSQTAAACFMLALNALSKKCDLVGSFETDMEIDDCTESLEGETCALRRWSDEMADVTRLSRATDVKPAYRTLLAVLESEGEILCSSTRTLINFRVLYPECGAACCMAPTLAAPQTNRSSVHD